MADAHLRFGGGLAKGAAERLVIKYRIVAEAVRAARLFNHAAFDFASKCLRFIARAHQRDYADESGGAIFYAAKLVEEPGVIEVRGIDTGAPVECIHLDTRIVDEQISVDMRAI